MQEMSDSSKNGVQVSVNTFNEIPSFLIKHFRFDGGADWLGHGDRHRAGAGRS